MKPPRFAIKFTGDTLFMSPGRHPQSSLLLRNGETISIDFQLEPLLRELDRLGFPTCLSCWGVQVEEQQYNKSVIPSEIPHFGYSRIMFYEHCYVTQQRFDVLKAKSPAFRRYMLDGRLKHSNVNLPNEQIIFKNKAKAAMVGESPPEVEAEEKNWKMVLDIPHGIYNNIVRLLRTF